MIGTMPFLESLAAWWLLPKLVEYPAYKLPPIDAVLGFAWESIADGSLARKVLASLARVVDGFAIGMALAIECGWARVR